jgi:hypothetical protein
VRTEFSGGGCLDGAAAEVVSGSTYQCRDSGASYSIDDDTGLLIFAGHGPFGREMALIMSGLRQDARAEQEAAREREAIAAASAPRGCGRCGRTYASASAYAVHFEHGEGSRCLPGDARGQLEQVDGVWQRIGSGH